MDNITHSLVGVLVAEACCALRARRRPIAPNTASATSFRALSLVVSVVANNFPDLDFAYRRITPGTLGYLLHHRGHTHTVPGALALGAVTWLGALAWLRLRRAGREPGDAALLAGLAWLGPLLHVLLDYQNNYGVHPFWPLYDGWYYGDVVFIVEPLLWAVAVPPLAFMARTRVGSAGLGLVLGAGVALALLSRATLPGTVAGIVAVAAVSTVAAWRLPRRRLALAVTGWLLVTACFAGAGAVAARHVGAAVRARFPDTRLVDLARTPTPSNPFCWSFLAVGAERERYVVRKATASILPSWFAPERCPALDSGAFTAPLARAHERNGGVLWEGTYSSPLPELSRLARTDCEAAAFLRFSRVPFEAPGIPTVVGDLRFDRSPKIEFAELPLSGGAPCPRHIPPWTPPLHALLDDGPSPRRPSRVW